MEARFTHPEKSQYPMLVTLAGMFTVVRLSRF
jgi:hypothetical protein